MEELAAGLATACIMPVLRCAGQGDTLSGSISPVDVATICIGALHDPDADGVTFEVIDEWAKAPDEQPAGRHHAHVDICTVVWQDTCSQVKWQMTVT